MAEGQNFTSNKHREMLLVAFAKGLVNILGMYKSGGGYSMQFEIGGKHGVCARSKCLKMLKKAKDIVKAAEALEFIEGNIKALNMKVIHVARNTGASFPSVEGNATVYGLVISMANPAIC